MTGFLRACTILAMVVVAAPAPAAANDLVPDSGVPRFEFAGVMLADGTVLVAAGRMVVGGASTNWAQRYDPFTNTWIDAGFMGSTHSGYQLGRLRDGGVVLADNGNGYFEFFDFDTGTWIFKGAWARPRAVGALVEASNGRLIGAAGRIDGLATEPAIEELGPDGGWSIVGALSFGVSDANVLFLADGDLLVVGGSDAGYVAVNYTQRLSPDGGGFVPRTAAPMGVARFGGPAVLLPDGRVLAAGGLNTSVPTPAEVYDPVANTWSDAGFTTAGRQNGTGTMLPNGRVYVAGGKWASTTAQVYDPDGGTWTTVPVSIGRDGHVAAMLPTGKVLLVGGRDPTGIVTQSAEVYDPSVPVVASAPALAAQRSGAAAAVVATNGSAFILGGMQGAALSSTEVLAPGAAAWSPGPAMLTPRARPVAATLTDGRILVTGGGASAEVFDPGHQAFHAAAPMAVGRDGHALVRLASGRVLAVGGVDAGQPLASAEVYDPGADQWTRANDLPRPGGEMTATLLPSGQVLIAGGSISGGGPSAETFVFNEAALSFSPALPMSAARWGHAATLLNSGMVLVTGGIGASGPLASAEWFDPATGAWTPLPPMGSARASHSAVLLQNSKVLLAGGDGPGSTELFDIVPKAFRPGPPLGSSLATSTVLLLPDHRVLFVGGATNAFFDEGRGARPQWTPSINPPGSVVAGASVRLTGQLFTGLSTGTGNQWRDIPANLPLLTARLPGGADVRLRLSLWDGTSALAQVPGGLPMGPYAITATVNGVPSASQTLWVGGANGSVCSAPGDCLSRTCDAGTCDAPPEAPAAICSPLCLVGCDCSVSTHGAAVWVCAVMLALLGIRRKQQRV